MADLLGVRVDCLSKNEIISRCQHFLQDSKPKQITTINGEFIIEAQKNADFKSALNNADLNVIDSTNVFWALRRKGLKPIDITPGSDLTLDLCQIAIKHHKSVYLLGGRADVPQKAAQKLKKLYPSLRIAGYSAKDSEDPSIIDDLRAANPDIVFVGFGAPKQDIWISKNMSKLSAHILIGVGGTFDMLSGLKPRAPRWLRAIHLEWLWRLIIEPKRIARIWRALIVFPLLIARD